MTAQTGVLYKLFAVLTAILALILIGIMLFIVVGGAYVIRADRKSDEGIIESVKDTICAMRSIGVGIMGNLASVLAFDTGLRFVEATNAILLRLDGSGGKCSTSFARHISAGLTNIQTAFTRTYGDASKRPQMNVIEYDPTKNSSAAGSCGSDTKRSPCTRRL